MGTGKQNIFLDSRYQYSKEDGELCATITIPSFTIHDLLAFYEYSLRPGAGAITARSDACEGLELRFREGSTVEEAYVTGFTHVPRRPLPASARATAYAGAGEEVDQAKNRYLVRYSNHIGALQVITGGACCYPISRKDYGIAVERTPEGSCLKFVAEKPENLQKMLIDYESMQQQEIPLVRITNFFYSRFDKLHPAVGASKELSLQHRRLQNARAGI